MGWFNEFQLWLSTQLADPVVFQWVFLGLLGFLVFILSLAVGRILQQRFNPVKDRIDTVTRVEISSSRQFKPLDKESRGERLLVRLGRGLTPKGNSKRNKTVDRLAQLGYRSIQDLHIFNGLKLVGAVVLPLVVGTVLIGKTHMPMNQILAIMVITLLLGLILPDYVLTKKIKARQFRLRKSLPDALDMLVVCSEAGLGLNAAIQRVAMEMDIQHPELADELKTTMLHMGAGMDNRTALVDLAERTDIEEMRSLVATLQQAMRYGTSISDTLRAYSADMRNKRLERAQELAAKASVNMLIPIALCMLPAVLFVVLGPPMLRLVETLSGL